MSAEFPRIIARHWLREVELLAGFQLLLARCADDGAKKQLIMDALDQGAISADEAGLLITAMMLESA